MQHNEIISMLQLTPKVAVELVCNKVESNMAQTPILAGKHAFTNIIERTEP
jgi:hypothetical protein